MIPFEELFGRFGTGLPAHIVNEDPKGKVGVFIGFTVTLKDAVVAHCPALGVKI